ncbi:MAG: UPF0314 protein [Alphaproteobacteria bacterium]|nr:MAG: UPF0314 protein [Alphaproteobacteria bacterium]
MTQDCGPSARLDDRRAATGLAPLLARTWLALASVLLLQAAALLAMGRPLICPCGYVRLWYGEIGTPENSQHLVDWWTYMHILYGVALFVVLGLILPSMSVGQRLLIVAALALGWEVLENTPFIIERYRQGALAMSYSGDSIVNSLVDTLATLAGYLLAAAIPVRVVIVGAVLAELLSVYLIRDNLLLNAVQLVYPTETVSRWQVGQ